MGPEFGKERLGWPELGEKKKRESTLLGPRDPPPTEARKRTNVPLF